MICAFCGAEPARYKCLFCGVAYGECGHGHEARRHECAEFNRLADYWFRCPWPVFLERRMLVFGR